MSAGSALAASSMCYPENRYQETDDGHFHQLYATFLRFLRVP